MPWHLGYLMGRLEKQKLTKMRGKTKKRHKHQRAQAQAPALLVQRLAELVQVLVLLQVVPVPEQDTRHMFWGRNDG
jgi:hypothetical protein